MHIRPDVFPPPACGRCSRNTSPTCGSCRRPRASTRCRSRRCASRTSPSGPSVWSGAELLGCGALKELDPAHGEIKSMRTASGHRRQGVARAMLAHIVAEARQRGYARLSLETGSDAPFEPAQRLYAGFGFTACAPFAQYTQDPNSVFMTLAL